MTAEPSRAAGVAHVALRLGRLMLVKGADTQLIESKVGALAERAGYAAHLLVWPEGLLLTVESGDSFRTKLGHGIAGMTVDMGALTRLDRIAGGESELGTVDRVLEEVERGGSRYPGWAVVLGMGLTAACLARLFGGVASVVAVSALVGVISTVLRQWLGARRANPVAAAFAIALLSGLVGAIAMRAFPGTPPTLCLVTAGMILTPGVPLINGVRDALAGHVGMGIARLAVAAITVLAIAFALFLAALLAGDTFPIGGTPQSLPLLEDVIVSGLAAIGFALLFNVPANVIWACVLCGMAGHGIRTALGHVGWNLASGSLVGALAAALLARFAARHFAAPPVAFAFPGVVAMIPGSYAFRAGIGGLAIMQAGAGASAPLVAETLSLAVTAVLMVCAIAIGLSIALASPFVTLKPAGGPATGNGDRG